MSITSIKRHVPDISPDRRFVAVTANCNFGEISIEIIRRFRSPSAAYIQTADLSRCGSEMFLRTNPFSERKLSRSQENRETERLPRNFRRKRRIRSITIRRRMHMHDRSRKPKTEEGETEIRPRGLDLGAVSAAKTSGRFLLSRSLFPRTRWIRKYSSLSLSRLIIASPIRDLQ